MEATPHYVYLACCANGTLSVGSTRNVARRIAQHNAGSGGRYTRRNRPLELMAVWTFSSRMAARQAERALKRLPPERKRALATATFSPGQDS
jgi:putative endonuclease